MAAVERTVYGRSDGADVVLANDTVSGRHCELSVTHGVYSLRDLGSTNGTFVNGERITTVTLNAGDRVHLGTAGFRFLDGQLQRDWDLDAAGEPSEGPRRDQGRSTTSVAVVVGLVAVAAIVAIVLVSRDNAPSPVIPVSTTVTATVPAATTTIPPPTTTIPAPTTTLTIPVTTAVKPVETTVDISTTIKPLPPPTTVNLYNKPANSDEMKELIKQAEDAVVLVICQNPTRTMQSTGSGWPLKTDIGVVIVTNEHVVAECTPPSDWRLIVDRGKGPEDEKWEEAEIYSSDGENDLAIIKIQASLEPLATAGPPKKLHWVMAVGNPISGVDSITEGYVSNYDNYRIVHSAAINPGNSGGPLINAEGKVVGVNTLKAVGEEFDNIGIAFALHRLCEQLIPTCPDHWQE